MNKIKKILDIFFNRKLIFSRMFLILFCLLFVFLIFSLVLGEYRYRHSVKFDFEHFNSLPKDVKWSELVNVNYDNYDAKAYKYRTPSSKVIIVFHNCKNSPSQKEIFDSYTNLSWDLAIDDFSNVDSLDLKAASKKTYFPMVYSTSFGPKVKKELFQIFTESLIIYFTVAFSGAYFVSFLWFYFRKILEGIRNFSCDNFNLFSFICLCFLAYCAWPYNYLEDGFYILLRLLISSLSGLIVYKEFKINAKSRWIIVFGIIALIFNPIKMVTFSDWFLIDLVTFCLISLYLFAINKRNNIEKQE